MRPPLEPGHPRFHPPPEGEEAAPGGDEAPGTNPGGGGGAGGGAPPRSLPPPLYESAVPGLSLVGRGKVRDLYALDPDHLLIVATDRLSAFDVVLPDPIPGKGEVLTVLSEFWFARTTDIVPNHRQDVPPLERFLADDALVRALAPRAVVVRRVRPLPLEAIVRGYLAGSGWKEYRERGSVSGVALPPGLRQADRLPEPIFTPSSKAAPGEHDENVTFGEVAALIGEDTARAVRATSLALYERAARHAAERGILIADTKLEFGTVGDELLVIDELFTPDSSRFWPAEAYRPGISPPSFDKQYVRDYLERIGWDKRPPAPRLPPEIIERTAAKYREARARMLGPPLDTSPRPAGEQ